MNDTKCKIIDGKARAKLLLENVKSEVKSLKKLNITPGLAVILVGEDPASVVYTNIKTKRANEIGISSKIYKFSNNISESELTEHIQNLNNDNSISGILVQLPLPKHINSHSILESVAYNKDVDGFHTHNIGLLNSWQDSLEPCTPKGALILIKSVLGSDISGKKAVVLGRSRIVGRPMISMLIRESCSVVALNSKSKDIQDECRNADILVSAVGSPQMIKKDWIKPGACIIDVGIVKVGDKLYGDVDFDCVKETNCYITPVPGGVGPMTVACLMQNTVKAAYINSKIFNK